MGQKDTLKTIQLLKASKRPAEVAAGPLPGSTVWQWAERTTARPPRQTDQPAPLTQGSQQPSGGFVTMLARRQNMARAIPVTSVFAASFVLHALALLPNCAPAKAVASKTINFILEEQGRDGLWRGLASPKVPPDIDSICCVLASFGKWNVTLDYDLFIRRLLGYRLDGGAFFTFVLDTDPGIVPLQNDIDWVVNANVLFFFSSLGHQLPEVEAYLEEVVVRDLFTGGSKYYPSPFAFTYCLSRAVLDGRAQNLAKLLDRLSWYVRSAQESDPGFGSPLDAALAVATLLNCGTEPHRLEKDVGRLVEIQERDGGWPLACFFEGPQGYYYGSRALTTAVAMEALAKYQSRQP